MEIRTIDDKNQINEFLKAQDIISGSFLQSFFWGEFQKEYGYKIWRLGFFEKNELQGIALVIKHPLPYGKSYLYCPKGPVLDVARPPASSLAGEVGRGSKKLEVGSNMFGLFFEKLKEIVKQENAIFFRFEPPITISQFELIKNKLGIKKTQEVQPESTWLLDLKKSEEEIFNQMKQKTRYNIRLSEKKKVQVKVTSELKMIDSFFDLVQQTTKRNKIRPHPKAYYLKMLEVFSQENLIKFYLAEYNQKNIAANLVISYGKTTTYLHGGSSSECHNVMAPYLLHWQAIRDAKHQGMEYYDFGGVSSEDELNHKWAGISRFKRSFGGFQVDSCGTFDKVFSPYWYSLYKFGRRLGR